MNKRPPTTPPDALSPQDLSPSIEPDLKRAPPPPAWKYIPLPKPLPGVTGPKIAPGGSRYSTPAWEVSAIGIEFVMLLLVCLTLGYGVDYWLGISPWGILIGTFAGIGGGGYRMVRAGLRAVRQTTKPS